MDTFYDYIHNVAMPRFRKRQRGGEAFYGMYNTVAAVVRDRADSLTVTHTRVLYSKDGTTFTLFDIGRSEEDWEKYRAAGKKGWTSFREALRQILGQDKRVQQHLQLIEETPHADTYRVIPEQTTQPGTPVNATKST